MIRDLMEKAPSTPHIGVIQSFVPKTEAGSDYYSDDSGDCKDTPNACLEAFLDLRNGDGVEWATTMVQKRPITVLGKPFTTAEALHAHPGLRASGYGNAETQTTEVDETVRKAKDTDDFAVPDALTDDLVRFWMTRVNDDTVHVVPYKVNVYGPGDFFKRHLDTPDADLIGTIVVGLPSLAGLVLGPDADAGSVTRDDWDDDDEDRVFVSAPARFDHWEAVAFFTSVPHAVVPVEAFRATIAFKVFKGCARPDPGPGVLRPCCVPRPDPVPHAIAIGRWFALLPDAFGIVFAHPYNTDVNLRGIDQEIYTFLARGGCFVEQIPVVVDAEIYRNDDTSNDEGLYSGCATVHALLPCAYKKVPFWHLGDALGTVWTSQRQRYIEHTGNESQPYNKKSIYMSIAMVCKKPGTK